MGDILGILGALGARPAATATPQPEMTRGRAQSEDGDNWSGTRGHKARKGDDDDKD